MFSTVAVVIVSLFFLYCFSQYRSLQRNIAEAKQSGFKYVVSPIYFQAVWWIILQDALLPYLSKLPSAWTEPWLLLSLFSQLWHQGYEPFAKAGEDTIMIVSAAGNILWTCDPEVNYQISNRRQDFAKPIDMLGMLNIYGPTITASEGEEHRVYRKVASPSFNNDTHRNVWVVATKQANTMLDAWNANRGLVSDLNADAGKLALHVISKVFFNKNMEWSGEDKPSPGHTLTYSQAISSVFHHNSTLFLTPRLILNNSPSKTHKEAREAFTEWQKHMEEMRDDTAARLSKQKPKEDGTLLENLVKAGTPGLRDSESSISPAAILGNMFIFILAGHETSANTLTYAITLLACKPNFQKALQANIDKVLGSRPSSTLSYPNDYTALMSGHIGALMQETLRLYTVLPFFPKTTEKSPQPLTIEGRCYTIPANTLIMTNTSATHRNPKYWPRVVKTAGDGPPYPLSSFEPERWLSSDGATTSGKRAFDPKPGAYIPFAEGYRSCLGQRFAQVEFCASIVTIFSKYSVELVSGDGSEGLTADSLRRAEEQLSSGVGFEMGLKPKSPVPLRVVKRGK